MNKTISVSVLIISLSYAFSVYIDMNRLNLEATQTVIHCENHFEGEAYKTCEKFSLKYGILNEE
jgi:hypothetical protein